MATGRRPTYASLVSWAARRHPHGRQVGPALQRRGRGGPQGWVVPTGRRLVNASVSDNTRRAYADALVVDSKRDQIGRAVLVLRGCPPIPCGDDSKPMSDFSPLLTEMLAGDQTRRSPVTKRDVRPVTKRDVRRIRYPRTVRAGES